VARARIKRFHRRRNEMLWKRREARPLNHTAAPRSGLSRRYP
jgi:hypothetical protein